MLELEQAILDWLTLTTFDKKIADNWRNIISLVAGKNAYCKGRKHLQYEGYQWKFGEGTAFWGKAEQRPKRGGARRGHYIVMLTSRLADFARKQSGIFADFSRFGEDALLATVNCTRIDLQCTVLNDAILDENKSSRAWQRAFFDHVDSVGKITSWMESDGQWGRLATVGINSRTGAVYHRVYAKSTANGDAIRFETEYTKPTSQRVASLVFNDKTAVGGLVKKQVRRIKYEPLTAVFNCLERYEEKKIPVAVRNGASGTELWLLSTALPALKRCLRESEQSELLSAAFGEAVDNYRQTTLPNWGELELAVGDGKHAI